MPACCPYHTVVCAHLGAGEVPMEMAMATVLAPCTYPCIHDRFRSDVSLIHGPLRRPSGAAAPPAGLHHQKSRTNHRYPYPPPSLFISLFSYWHAVRPGKFHVIFLCSGKLFALETKIDILQSFAATRKHIW